MFSDHRSAEQLQVLVVEPKQFVAARLKEQLESLGHRVLGLARDGREAVAAAQRLRPNLVLMETVLPGLDGIDAARAIVTDQPVPVILLTGYVGADLVRRAKDAGVVVYLTSLEQKRLLSAIDVALERFGEFRILQKEGSDLSETLATRRLVDQAKKVLIRRLGVSEAEAFLHILKRKVSTSRNLREIAWTIIDAEEALSRVGFTGCLQLIYDAIRRDLSPRAKPSDALSRS